MPTRFARLARPARSAVAAATLALAVASGAGHAAEPDAPWPEMRDEARAGPGDVPLLVPQVSLPFGWQAAALPMPLVTRDLADVPSGARVPTIGEGAASARVPCLRPRGT